jgi:hypothetical protein
MKGSDLLPFAARILRQIREFAGMSMFFMSRATPASPIISPIEEILKSLQITDAGIKRILEG